jgi:ABC-type transport system involved in multi-copper enzyme maturation permease subunit
MRTLLAVEFRRLFARRMLQVMTLVLALLFVGIGTLVFFISNDSQSAIDEAKARRATEVAACVADGGFDGATGADVQKQCEEGIDLGDPRFKYNEMDWIQMSFTVPLMLLTALIGASFVGAEWHHRTMTAHLTWEPRRTRVLVSKIAAVVIGVALWTLAIQGILAASFYPAAAFRGSLAGVDAAWWADYGLLMLRVSGLAAVAASFGAAIAFIGRNTAAALGACLVYVAFVEGLVRALKPAWIDWLVGDNAGQLMTGDVVLDHGVTASAALLFVYALALALMALSIFRRREIA